MISETEIWPEFVGQNVVLDVDAPFVYVGEFVEVRAGYVVLKDADAHDLRDTTTSREKYVVDCREHGLRANRQRVFVDIRRMVAISRLDDVIN